MAYSTNQHSEWLSLIEVSGPFLAEPVLNQAFPQGLEKVDPIKKRQFRQTYDEWREIVDSDSQNDIAIKDRIHQQWVNWVLKFGLELDEDEDGDILKDSLQMNSSIQISIPEHNISIKPEFAVIKSDDTPPYMLIQSYPAGTALSEVLKGDSWSTSPAERMAHLCRGLGTRLGLITNGEQWMFIDAPAGGITTYASWFARLWGLEPVTLKAFYSLFNIGIVFNGFDEAKSLAQLIDESLQHQDDVTQTLGTQVSRAVEVLIQSIDRINHDHHGELLEGVEPEELYEAGLTLMMRLVFLLCAEERGLLLLGDESFEANYAISTLRAKLRQEASLHGEEVLSYRKNAWSRLLATFRSVYAGVEHENMRMPALGGSLFDPDRFPFLEGRTKNSNWLEDEAKPLPIDNRTVLLFLDAIQLYQGRTLSYRALDVEQIGYVYEGLLEQTVKRAPDVTLELSGSKSCKKPWVHLGELASASLNGETALKKLLKERTASSPSRITNDLTKEVTDAHIDKLMVACYNDIELCQRIKPYYHFLRFDAWGNPLLYPKNAYMLTTGSDRRETGSHYTPKSLTESIVTDTLEPVVYFGPAEGKPREEWQLKSPEALLDLKICDPAMGSGAFLVQVCRWLAERVCESWLIAEQNDVFITAKGFTTKDAFQDLIPIDAEERLIVAKRLISEQCLYGVDINPLAVELAKLSIWLVTLSKNRPFGFLDHNLKSGDSLLGIHNLDQLSYLNLNPSQTKKSKLVEQPFTKQIKKLVADTLALRKQIATHDINLVSDIDEMAQLEQQARQKIILPKLIADALIGLALESGGKLRDISTLSTFIQQAVAGDKESLVGLKGIGSKGLSSDLPERSKARKAFHWILEFPEVFNSLDGGFDAIVGNPPFLGGKKVSGAMGKGYRNYLINALANGMKGSADFVAYFFLKSNILLKNNSTFGLIGVNTIAEGETRKVGLDSILTSSSNQIYRAKSNEKWPGAAAVVTSRVHIYKGNWRGSFQLNSEEVSYISPYLTSREEWTPSKIRNNRDKTYQGVVVLGMGFVLSESEAIEMLQGNIKNREVIYPYINGKDLNTNPTQMATRFVINFWDWTEEKAMEYIEPYKTILDKVKPERQLLKANGDFKLRKPLPQRWWQYADKRPALFHKINRGDLFSTHPAGWNKTNEVTEKVLVNARVGKYFTPNFIPNTSIFHEKIIIFTDPTFEHMAFMNSSIVDRWMWSQCSKLGYSLNFSPSDGYETLPIPEILGNKKLSGLGVNLYNLRSGIMENNNYGMTELYNRVHNPECIDLSITSVRDLIVKIDKVVAELYGWDASKLNHDFYEVADQPKNDCVRFTLGEELRDEILNKISLMNKYVIAKEQEES